MLYGVGSPNVVRSSSLGPIFMYPPPHSTSFSYLAWYWMMSSLPSLLKDGNEVAIPKNLESSAVWMPSSSSLNHLPAVASHFPTVPSLSFHLLTVQRLSQPSPKVSEKYIFPWARVAEPATRRAR